MILIKNPILYGIVILLFEYLVYEYFIMIDGAIEALLWTPLSFLIAGVVSVLVIRKQSTRTHVVIIVATYFGISVLVGTSMLITAGISFITSQVGIHYAAVCLTALSSYFAFYFAEKIVMTNFIK